MAQARQVMLERIAALKDSVFSLCSSINSCLKKSEPTRKNEFKPVVAELRLLGGTLHSLESLVQELDGREENSTPESTSGDFWPVVDGCELLIEALESFHSHATSDGLRAARTSLLDYRSKFGFVLGSSESIQDIVLQFIILGSDPVPKLLAHQADLERTRESSHTLSENGEQQPTPEEVSAWLTLLNAPENDREPEEFNREVALVRSRRLTIPHYRRAAAQWPKYAETYWSKLRPQICSLFRLPKSYNLVQWALEYAKETYPRVYGSSALSPKLLLELTDALCDGTISSLHIAAALGLPSLCRDLISMGTKVNQNSLLGTPLFCALVGPRALATRAAPDSWTSLLVNGDSSADRAATVLLLLDKGADCKFQYQWKNADETSLAGLAFWVALTTKYESVFTRIISQGAAIDDSFSQLLQRGSLIKRGMVSKTRFARLITHVYDLTLSDGAELEAPQQLLQKTVSGLMKHTKLKFAFLDDNKRVACLKDDRFDLVLRAAVLDSDASFVERLSHDPRFNPNLSYDLYGGGGTILHMATEGSQFDIMDVLIRAGANLSARDNEGRTPIMVVEETAALSKLVLDHGASTTDVDNDGRTIWHLVAATNDHVLLKWLCENDPCKKQNLAAICSKGLTPLGSALNYFNALKHLPQSNSKVQPTAARLLLKEHNGQPYPTKTEGLAQMAVVWGELDVLEQVLKIVPEVDETGCSLLHHLNMSASDEVVDLVLKTSQASPQQLAKECAAAETVITNTFMFGMSPNGFRRLSAHPGCFPSMTKKAYKRLLVPEALLSLGSEDKCIWTRFCENVFPMLSGKSSKYPAALTQLSEFITMAISCLADCGVLTAYKERTGTAPVFRMCGAKKKDYIWSDWQIPLVIAVLEQSSADSTLDFFQSYDAVSFLRLAVGCLQTELVSRFVDKGFEILRPWPQLSGRSFFEDLMSVATVPRPVLLSMLEMVDSTEMFKRQHEIFDALLGMPNRMDAARLFLQLMAKGINPNQISPSTTRQPKQSLLVQAIVANHLPLVETLMTCGTNPSLGVDGYSPLMAIADLGRSSCLVYFTPDEVEFDWYHEWENPQDGLTYSALQLAASKGHSEILEYLVRDTPAGDIIDEGTSKNPSPPMHLAIRAQSLACVRVFTECDANLEYRDSLDRTPLALAVEVGNVEIVKHLMDCLEPSDAMAIGVSAATLELYSKACEIIRSQPKDTHATPKRLGTLIASRILTDYTPNGVLNSLLVTYSQDEIKNAIMPCDGCSPLSFAAAHDDIQTMVGAVSLDLGGLTGGCSKHWPSGYNALLDACQQLGNICNWENYGEWERDVEDKDIDTFFWRCLDRYLSEGMLWLQLPCSPLYLLCQFREEETTPCRLYLSILRIFRDHLVQNAEKYWSMAEEAGLCDQFQFDSTEECATKVLRLAFNLPSRERRGEIYTGGGLPTPLHMLVDMARNDLEFGSVFRPIDKGGLYGMFNLLVACGSDVNAQDDELETPLHLAAMNGNVNFTSMLLEAGANPNARGCDHRTPLGVAVHMEHPEIVRLLLDHGADPQTFVGVMNLLWVDGPTMSSLCDYLNLGMDPYATLLGHPGEQGIAAILLRQDKVPRSFILNGNFDFYRLAEQDPPLLSDRFFIRCIPDVLKKVLRRLPKEYLTRALSPNMAPGLSPVCLTIREEKVEMLKILLDFGLSVERECCELGSPLMYAAKIGAFKSFKMLIRYGAQVSYVHVDEHGGKFARSAVEAAMSHPKLLTWLLTGRYYESHYIGWTDSQPGSLGVMRSWSGPRQAEYRLSGSSGHFGRMPSESMVKYLKRETNMRRDLAGQVLRVKLLA